MRALALVLALLALAGCAGGNGDGDGSGADTTSADQQLDTELRQAVRANELAEARRLLDEGANPNTPDASRESAFLIASSELGPEPAMLELLLENGADVDAADANGSTAVIRAAQRGYPELVGPLIEAEADLDHVNDLNFTALLATVILGDGSDPYVETVRLLLKGGADPNIPDTHGTLPVVHAELAGHTEIVQLLREAELED